METGRRIKFGTSDDKSFAPNHPWTLIGSHGVTSRQENLHCNYGAPDQIIIPAHKAKWNNLIDNSPWLPPLSKSSLQGRAIISRLIFSIYGHAHLFIGSGSTHLVSECSDRDLQLEYHLGDSQSGRSTTSASHRDQWRMATANLEFYQRGSSDCECVQCPRK